MMKGVVMSMMMMNIFIMTNLMMNMAKNMRLTINVMIMMLEFSERIANDVFLSLRS